MQIIDGRNGSWLASVASSRIFHGIASFGMSLVGPPPIETEPVEPHYHPAQPRHDLVTLSIEDAAVIVGVAAATKAFRFMRGL
jgi:hypothetical protein